jgi:hypothetical protein
MRLAAPGPVGINLKKRGGRAKKQKEHALPRLLLCNQQNKPQIEAFTEEGWDIPTVQSVMRLLEDYDSFSVDLDNGNFPAQQFMVYLRHHGFPSPLLD